jgi:hypothetical protein
VAIFHGSLGQLQSSRLRFRDDVGPSRAGTANVVSFQSELIVLRDNSAKIRKAKDQVDSGQQNDRAQKRYRNPIGFRDRRAPSRSSLASVANIHRRDWQFK